jgi:periplasmic protein TonB
MKVFITLAVAIILHGIFIYTVLLKLPMREQKAPQYMDVTLITQPADKKPKEAKSIATDNQLASKSASDAKERVARQKEEKATSSPVKEKTAKRVAPALSSESKPSPQSSEIIKEDADKPRLSPELLQQQISQLGSDIRKQTMETSSQRVKFIDSVSASKAIAAQYLKDFESKVERTGNMNYPEVAMQKDFSGTLTMDVGIKADGSVYSIRINQSSGNPALDEAAKKIVRMSAPFPALPTDLLKELDVLIITRVLRFSDQSGITTQ